MRILFEAVFDRYSGYGNDSVDLARFMERAGVDVTLLPRAIMPGLPREFTQLLEKDPTGHHDVIMSFLPPFDIQPRRFAHLAPTAVGYSMWEKSLLVRENMLAHGWAEDVLRSGKFWSAPDDGAGHRGDLDLMMVTCPMNVEAFHALDPDVRIEVVPCGIDAEEWPEMDRTGREGPMRFAMVGMLAGRKDPFSLLHAWKELKDEVPEFDAVLDLKTSCPGLHPKLVEWYPDVTLYDRAWPREKLVEWFRSVDVLISVSRGEGNNKPAMEFMSTGGPVMATDWSGHQNWLHPDASYPLRGTLTRMSPDDPVMDFRVDVDHLKETLLSCWQNPEEVRRKGKIAASMIRQTLTWEHVVDRMVRLIGQAVR